MRFVHRHTVLSAGMPQALKTAVRGFRGLQVSLKTCCCECHWRTARRSAGSRWRITCVKRIAPSRRATAPSQPPPAPTPAVPGRRSRPPSPRFLRKLLRRAARRRHTTDRLAGRLISLTQHPRGTGLTYPSPPAPRSRSPPRRCPSPRAPPGLLLRQRTGGTCDRLLGQLTLQHAVALSRAAPRRRLAASPPPR